MNQTSRNIVLIDDSDSDVLLTVEALKRITHAHSVLRFAEGESALQYMQGKNGAAKRPAIDLVLLDINLPGMSGKDVLQTIKRDKENRKTPVIMLSSSKSEKDINESFELHANSYLVKPLELNEWFNTVTLMCDYWFSVAELPRT